MITPTEFRKKQGWFIYTIGEKGSMKISTPFENLKKDVQKFYKKNGKIKFNSFSNFL